VRGERDVAQQNAETGDSSMDRQSCAAITLSEDGVVVEAELVSEKLGLSPAAFWREMKRGIVYGVVERGEGGDAGRMRLTFRYRARSWTVTVEEKLDDNPLG
jgi:predicted ArsR family transcriptional regulator